MNVKRYLLCLCLLLGMMLYVLFNTRPEDASLVVLFIPFICIFGIASLTVYSAARRFGRRPHSVGVMSFSLFMGALIALTAGLNSVGSLLPREIAIVLVFFSLLIFYLYKRRN